MREILHCRAVGGHPGAGTQKNLLRKVTNTAPTWHRPVHRESGFSGFLEYISDIGTQADRVITTCRTQ
jgi:hypothetical protein